MTVSVSHGQRLRRWRQEDQRHHRMIPTARSTPTAAGRYSPLRRGRRCGIPKLIRDSDGKLFQAFLCHVLADGEDDVFINGHKKLSASSVKAPPQPSPAHNERGRAVVWTKQASDDGNVVRLHLHRQRLPVANESTTLEFDTCLPTNPGPSFPDTHEGHRKRLGNLQNMLTEYTARTYVIVWRRPEIRITVEPRAPISTRADRCSVWTA